MFDFLLASLTHEASFYFFSLVSLTFDAPDFVFLLASLIHDDALDVVSVSELLWCAWLPEGGFCRFRGTMCHKLWVRSALRCNLDLCGPMATGGDDDLLSRIVVLERCTHAWERERKRLEGQITSLEGENKSLEGQNESLEGQNKSLEGQIKSLEGQMKSLERRIKYLEGENTSLEGHITNLERWQLYRETCAESDSIIWGTPFLLGTVGELFQCCLRRQPSAKTLSNHFWKRRWSSAVRRASTYLSMSPPDFARFADSCIDERNANAAHFQTIDGLVDAIQHCRHLLTRYPLLQAQFPKQSLAISHFELLRAVFNFWLHAFCNQFVKIVFKLQFKNIDYRAITVCHPNHSHHFEDFSRILKAIFSVGSRSSNPGKFIS